MSDSKKRLNVSLSAVWCSYSERELIWVSRLVHSDGSYMTATSESMPARCSVHEIKLMANTMRHEIIQMLTRAGSGHPGGSLSAVDVIATLYFSGLMNYDENDPTWEGRDFFILSKGHAAPALYAAIHQLGWVSDEDIDSLRTLGSKLQGHPDSKVTPGVEVCTGSLGQGLSVGAGAALGFKLDAKRAKCDPRRVFVMTGDGELQEGQNWEAIMFAAQHHLDNLILYCDINNLQIDGRVTDVNSLGNLSAELCDFGWYVQEIDGNDVTAIENATRAALAYGGKPCAILCDTVKGKGVSFMEDAVGWHGSAPSQEQAAIALADLDRERQELESEDTCG